jgi:hypothetical protein
MFPNTVLEFPEDIEENLKETSFYSVSYRDPDATR